MVVGGGLSNASRECLLPMAPCSKVHCTMHATRSGAHLGLDAHAVADGARHAQQGEPARHLFLRQYKRQVSNLRQGVGGDWAGWQGGMQQ
jgi:hypothetical protein